MQNARGCDSIIHLNLQLSLPVSIQTSANICQGSSYLFKGQNLTAAGNYEDTLTTHTGCDSIIHLALQVTPQVSSQLNAAICNGDSYLFKGQNLTAAGNYADTLTAVTGCDSIIHLALQVTPQISSQLNETICSGSSYLFKGQNLTTAGNYADTLTAVSGCDSIIHLALQVTPQVSSQLNAAICNGDSYLFKGQNLIATGNYEDTLTAVSGCDSIVHLALQVTPQISSQFSQTICWGTSYAFNGQQLTNPGNYADTLTAQGGCDSIIRLILNVH